MQVIWGGGLSRLFMRIARLTRFTAPVALMCLAVTRGRIKAPPKGGTYAAPASGRGGGIDENRRFALTGCAKST